VAKNVPSLHRHDLTVIPYDWSTPGCVGGWMKPTSADHSRKLSMR
jgi:hypothetical protein